jgi:hypothetical protein
MHKCSLFQLSFMQKCALLRNFHAYNDEVQSLPVANYFSPRDSFSLGNSETELLKTNAYTFALFVSAGTLKFPFFKIRGSISRTCGKNLVLRRQLPSVSAELQTCGAYILPFNVQLISSSLTDVNLFSMSCTTLMLDVSVSAAFLRSASFAMTQCLVRTWDRAGASSL